jgi:hypothetical protein
MVYAYPWDYVGDPDAAARAANLGLDAVAVAASYPRREPLLPSIRTTAFSQRSVRHAMCRSEKAWSGRRLIPAAPDWGSRRPVVGDACRQLTARGLAVEAWIVLTPNGALGEANPDLVVRNAFDDVYPYALCPAAEEVQEYCATLVKEALSSGPLLGVVLEACGPMGIDHAGDHDKIEFAGWDEARRALLSLCFCRACEGRYSAVGIESADLARLVRRGIDEGRDTVEECLGDLAGMWPT